MKVYKLKEKTETGVVIIGIKSRNITPSQHQLIEKVSGTGSDIFFIFPRSVMNEIDPFKFSNLYSGNWYGVYSGDEISGYWEALDYLEEISSYTSMTVFTDSWGISGETLEKLKRLQYSGIETSVFEIRDLTLEEKKDLYTIPPRVFKAPFGYRFKWFGKKDSHGAYSTKTSGNHIFFLRPTSVREIKSKVTPEILHSFRGLGFGSFISSMISSGSHTNLSVNEAKI